MIFSPFIRLTLFFVFGMVCQYYLGVAVYSLHIALVGALLCLVALLPAVKKRYAYRFLFGIGLMLVVMASAAKLTECSWERSAWELSTEKRSYTVYLRDDPVMKPRTILCEVGVLSSETDAEAVCGKRLLVYLPQDSLAASLRAGDQLCIAMQVEQPTPFGDDPSFDYPLYLRKQGVAGIAFVRRHDWQRSEHRLSLPLTEQLRCRALTIRSVLLRKLRSLLPNDKHYAVAAAIVFGYKSLLDKEQRAAFSSIGAAHILAVSGLHLSIVFGFIYSLFGLFGNSRRAVVMRQLVVLPLLWTFAFVTGLSPSIVRASLMMSLWGIGQAFLLRPFTMNTVGVAAFFMLLVNPLYLFDVGFQLSFSAVIAIVLLNPYLTPLYFTRNPLLRYSWNLLTVSTSAQIGVLPLSVYYFHQFPLVFLLSNLFVVPMTTLLLLVIPVGLFVQLIPGTSIVVGRVLAGMVEFFLEGVERLSELPYAALQDLHIRPGDAFSFYILLALLVLLILKKRVVYLYLILLLVALQVISYL